MKIIEYNHSDKTQLTSHYKVSEWKCKCGKVHSIKIADTLPPLLEKLMSKIGAVRGDLSSGYRCPTHDKKVGGSGSGPHTQGYACDIKFTDQNGKIIDSKYVALALEDLGHNYGIGYKCGGNKNYTHIDVKPRKWYGDESKSTSKSCCSSFYTYFGVAKTISVEKKPDNKKYIQIKAPSGVWCRKGIGFKYAKYKVIPNKTKCELLTKNAGKSNGYNWDKVIYNGITVYLPNNWNLYL